MTGDQILWQVSFDVPEALVECAEFCLEEHGAISVSVFENPHDMRNVSAVFESEPDLNRIGTTDSVLLPSQYLATATLKRLQNIDWVARTNRLDSPRRIGPFIVRSRTCAPRGRAGIHIIVDAGTAFGTGEHGTTAGCLLALADLRRRGFAADHVIDMGCGTGILSIAASYLWNCPILAVDNDRDAVLFAQEAVRVNQQDCLVDVTENTGFRDLDLSHNPPTNLIIANILAQSLVDMASGIYEVLRPGGCVILSGILGTQVSWVMRAFGEAGFSLLASRTIDDWVTITLARNYDYMDRP